MHQPPAAYTVADQMRMTRAKNYFAWQSRLATRELGQRVVEIHSQFQISVLMDGKPKALNIPAKLAEKVREKIAMRRRFDAAAATICRLNLKRLLKEKKERQA